MIWAIATLSHGKISPDLQVFQKNSSKYLKEMKISALKQVSVAKLFGFKFLVRLYGNYKDVKV